MEFKGKNPQLVEMYHKRLQNLSDVIERLHEHVGNDEALNNLEGEQMKKYRIDRVHQVVKEILQSQKQHMLMKVLQKLNEINCEKMGSSHHKEIEIKNKQILRLKMMNSSLQDEVRAKQKQIKQMLIRGQRQKEAKRQQQSIKETQQKDQQIEKLQKQLKTAYQTFAKLKKDAQQAINQLKQTNQILQQKMVKTQIFYKKIGQENTQLKEQINKKSIKNQTNVKIDKMNQQIIFLESELFEIGKNFSIIKDHALVQTLSKVDKLRKHLNRDSQIIRQELDNFKGCMVEIVKEQMEVLMAKNARVRKNNEQVEGLSQKIAIKVNQLDNQLDFFIQNQLIA